MDRAAMTEVAPLGESRDALDHLWKVLRFLRIDCVLDVGAHRGEYARLLRSVGFRGRIVSFEPVSATYADLAAAAAQDPAWETRRVALGREEEKRTINVSEPSPLSAFRDLSDYARRELPGDHRVTKEEVQVVSLDSVFDTLIRHGERVFFKADVEGWNREVLEGADVSLGRVAGLQLELAAEPLYEGEPRYFEVLPWLAARGFALTGIFPLAHDRFLRAAYLDCVMLRNAAAPRPIPALGALVPK
jgi:FkbM family methyltransferase